ncbi:hypothetical protein GGR51DRAFT_535268 [Nemania sp. FL0031]|nr:hypothetical protein GGR51DRAFT_535268 [Nemania sp. FL0031]
MPSAREAFKALGPVDWDSFAQEDPKTLIADIFKDAHELISSIPVSSKVESQKISRAQDVIDTDIPLPLNQVPECSEEARELRKEWKGVKINPRDNPLDLNIYKLAAKDGRGSWFARRSVHEGLSFRKWKIGMEREFPESLKVQGQPGDGKIRGLGADKCVVNQTVDGCGRIQVYQLSAQFPGPTSPRDFVTLCMTSDNATTEPASDGVEKSRFFMLVSKPCVHPECPERQGFIRGYYESVEFIREIKVDKPLHKTQPSEDGTGEDPSPSTTNSSDNAGEEVDTSVSQGKDTECKIEDTEHESQEGDSTIEWTMITRSDPGGSVPRFIIEKKTPEGIANDAQKFLQWISSENFEKLLSGDPESTLAELDTTRSETPILNTSHASSDSVSKPLGGTHIKSSPSTSEQDNPESPGPGGVYGMISGALGMVASAAASRLLGPSGESEGNSEISSSDSSDDASSIHTFHSFDATGDAEPGKAEDDEAPTPSASITSSKELLPSPESTSTSSRPSHHDKELKKLEERRRKIEEKLRRTEERALAKKTEDAQRDEAAQQKLREKHEREMARQEEKYQRERRKLEAKRAEEEKKAEERRLKQAERERKANLTLELEKTRAERDVARKEVEVLREMVRELQAVNTRLVARLGREGVEFDDEKGMAGSLGSGGLTPRELGREVTEGELERRGEGEKS